MYGRHAVDVVAHDEDEYFGDRTERFLRNPKKGNAKANGEFQRFLGQSLLATLAHRHVIGLCVAENKALDWTGPTGVNTLIVAPVAHGKTSTAETIQATMLVNKEIKLIIKRVP